VYVLRITFGCFHTRARAVQRAYFCRCITFRSPCAGIILYSLSILFDFTRYVTESIDHGVTGIHGMFTHIKYTVINYFKPLLHVLFAFVLSAWLERTRRTCAPVFCWLFANILRTFSRRRETLHSGDGAVCPQRCRAIGVVIRRTKNASPRRVKSCTSYYVFVVGRVDNNVYYCFRIVVFQK